MWQTDRGLSPELNLQAIKMQTSSAVTPRMSESLCYAMHFVLPCSVHIYVQLRIVVFFSVLHATHAQLVLVIYLRPHLCMVGQYVVAHSLVVKRHSRILAFAPECCGGAPALHHKYSELWLDPLWPSGYLRCLHCALCAAVLVPVQPLYPHQAN